MFIKELNSRDSGVIYILNYIVMVLAQIVFMFRVNTQDIPDWVLWGTMAINQAVFLIVTYVYISSKGINPIKIAGFNRKLTVKQIAMLPLITFLLLIASAPLAMIFSYLLTLIGHSNPTDMPDITNSWTSLIIAFFVISVFPPIGEEFLFRNGVLRGLKRRGYLTAAVITSVMFSLMHGNVDQLVHQFFVGMVLAFVMQVTGNLLAPMIIHFSNNFFALLLEFMMSGGGDTEAGEVTAEIGDGTYIIVLLLMVIFGSVLLIMALKHFLRLEKDKREDRNVIDIQTEGFMVKYFKTAKSMLKYVFVKRAREEMKKGYNDLISGLDYDKPQEEEQDILMQIVMKQKDNLTAVKFGILGASFIVALSFLAGFIVI